MIQVSIRIYFLLTASGPHQFMSWQDLPNCSKVSTLNGQMVGRNLRARKLQQDSVTSSSSTWWWSCLDHWPHTSCERTETNSFWCKEPLASRTSFEIILVECRWGNWKLLPSAVSYQSRKGELHEWVISRYLGFSHSPKTCIGSLMTIYFPWL